MKRRWLSLLLFLQRALWVSFIVFFLIFILTSPTDGANDALLEPPSTGEREVDTLGAPLLVLPAPGGVDTNLQLWLKADTGTNSSSDGAAITSWSDQSPNGYTAANNNADAPTYQNEAADLLNFNPMLRFDGVDDGLDLGSDYIFSANDGLNIFAVVRPASTTNKPAQFIFDFGWNADKGIGVTYGSETYRMYTPTAHGGAGSSLVASQGTRASLVTVGIEFGNEQRGYLDGLSVFDNPITLAQLTTAEISESPTSAISAGPVMIGRQSKSGNLAGRFFTGDYAELIVYDSNLSEAQRQQVQSYLALKYGITLDQSTAQDYVASDGSVIYAATTTLDGYDHNIAGIGRDDGSSLNQIKSSSIQTDTIVTIANGNDMGNPSPFALDNSFLIWGNDGITFTNVVSETVNGTPYNRLERLWRVQETGTVTETALSFDLSGVSVTWEETQVALLIDSDTDFSDATLHTTGLTINGDEISFSNVDFSSGDTFTLILQESNQAPTEITLSNATIAENEPISTTVGTFSTTDADLGDTHTYALVAGTGDEDNAFFTIDGDTLKTNESFDLESQESYHIRVESTDSDSLTFSKPFTITVTNVDEPPTVANPISDVTVEEDADDTIIDLTNVFTDIDNDDALITKAVQTNTNPSLVDATIAGNTLTLAYQAEQNGSATITIRATSNGQTVDDTFIVTVNAVDNPPTVANPISDVTVDEDADDTTIDLTNVFTDIDNDDALITKAVQTNTNPSLVNATIAGNTLTLDYQTDQNGSALIGIRATSNGQTVDDSFVVVVNAVDDSLIVINPIPDVTVDEDAPDTLIDLSNVFTDLDNDDALITKTVQINSNPDLVEATIVSDTLTLAYQADEQGTATITIRGTSGDSFTDDTFLVTVNPVDDAPIVLNPISDVTVDEDASLSTINLSAVFTDIDNDDTLISKEVHANSNPSLVQAIMTLDILRLNYQANQNGSATITIRATSNGLTVDDEFTITVNAVNDAPLAEDDSVQSEHNTALTIDVLANDSDIENDPLKLSVFTQPANGSVSLNLDHTLQYTPTIDFDGTDSFTYTIEDGNGGSAQATVNVTVLPANLPPVANDDSANTVIDSPVLINVVANDTDPHNDTLTLESITQPANGSAVIMDDTRVNYTPQSGISGVDTFTYTIEDGRGGSASATVIVNINISNNNPPIASDDSATTNEEMPVSINVLGNDSDPDNDPLTVQSLTQPPHGTASINHLTGRIGYTPHANFAGTDSFTYAVTDGQGSSDQATVTIEVLNINDAPVANQDIAITIHDNPVVIDILSNDSHPDGDPLTISALTSPLSGTAVLNGDGTVTYTLLDGMLYEYEWGLDSFEYTITDPDGESATATVLVNLNSYYPSSWPIARPDYGAQGFLIKNSLVLKTL